MSEVLGRVKMIGNTQEVSASFKKREIVVTTEEQYPQHILIEFSQDKCDLLNGIQIGESVKIGINLRGREWVNPQGETKYFNSIQGWRVDRMQTQAPQQPQQGFQQQQPQPQQQNFQPQQQQQQFQQQGYQQPMYSQQQNDGLPY